MGESLANWLISNIWQKKDWQINRSANRLLIVNTNLDGFTLANRRWFANSPSFPPAKLSRYMVCIYNACVYIPVWLFDFTVYVSSIFSINPAPPNVAPNNFRVIVTTSTNMTFQWDALSRQQANGVVQQYVITCTERNTNTEVSKIKALYLCNNIEEL